MELLSSDDKLKREKGMRCVAVGTFARCAIVLGTFLICPTSVRMSGRACNHDRRVVKIELTLKDQSETTPLRQLHWPGRVSTWHCVNWSDSDTLAIQVAFVCQQCVCVCVLDGPSWYRGSNSEPRGRP